MFFVFFLSIGVKNLNANEEAFLNMIAGDPDSEFTQEVSGFDDLMQIAPAVINQICFIFIERIMTPEPTRGPTQAPTRAPTRSPTRNPTRSPTREPTSSPTQVPTVSPTPSPTVKCQKKLYNEKFDNPALDWKGIDRSFTQFGTPKFWLGLSGDNDFSLSSSTSYFRVDDGKLVARDVGDSSRPENSVVLKTQKIDVEDLQQISVFLDVWKQGVIKACDGDCLRHV